MSPATSSPAAAAKSAKAALSKPEEAMSSRRGERMRGIRDFRRSSRDLSVDRKCLFLLTRVCYTTRRRQLQQKPCPVDGDRWSRALRSRTQSTPDLKELSEDEFEKGKHLTPARNRSCCKIIANRDFALPCDFEVLNCQKDTPLRVHHVWVQHLFSLFHAKNVANRSLACSVQASLLCQFV